MSNDNLRSIVYDHIDEKLAKFYNDNNYLVQSDIYYDLYILRPSEQESFLTLLYSLTFNMSNIYKKLSFFKYSDELKNKYLECMNLTLSEMESHIKDKDINKRINDGILSDSNEKNEVERLVNLI